MCVPMRMFCIGASVWLSRTSCKSLRLQVRGEGADTRHETVRGLIDDNGVNRVYREWLAASARNLEAILNLIDIPEV